MRTQLVLPLQSRQADEPSAVGDKAAGLNYLMRHGFPAPPGYCLFPKIAVDSSTTSLRGLPPDFLRAVSVICKKLKGLVAVRSSIPGGMDSIANNGAAFLGINGEEAVARSIIRCLNSLQCDERYGSGYALNRQGFFPIIVQKLVDAVASGTAVSRNAETGDDNEIIIQARWGIGGSSLLKKVKTDLYRLRKYPLFLLQKEIPSKAQEIRAGPVGLVRRPLPQARRTASVLTDQQAIDLALLVRKVEEQVGFPVEVEWALTSRRYYLIELQRALLTEEDRFYLTPESAGGDKEILEAFDAVDVPLESMSPLCWDLISRAIDSLWGKLTALSGLPRLTRTPPVVFVAGRVYFNLTDVAATIERSLHLASGTMRFLRAFRGDARSCAGRLARSLSLFRMCARMAPRLPNFLRYQRSLSIERMQSLQAEIEQEGSRLGEMKKTLFVAEEIQLILKEIEDFLIERLDIFVALQFESYQFRRFLHLLQRWCGAGGASMGIRMLAGLGTLDSTTSGYDLWALARQIKARTATSATAPDADPDGWQALQESEAGREIAATITAFRSSYGHHCIGEFDPAIPRWGDDISRILKEAGGFFEVPDETGPEDHLKRQADARSLASAWVEGRLALSWKRVMFWRIRRVRKMHDRFMRSCPLLENTRAGLVKLIWHYRSFLLLAGKHLSDAGVLGKDDDIFLLRSDEIQSALLGCNTDRLATALSTRARAQAYYKSLNLPGVIRGLYSLDDFKAPAINRQDSLTGLGVSPGRCRGPARIVRSYADCRRFRPGEILIAPSIDAGWAPMILRARAIVTEQGGPFSEVALIAREYGLPAVIGAKEAMSCLHNGDELEVDGESGHVKIIGCGPHKD